jgi:hypothetical protein
MRSEPPKAPLTKPFYNKKGFIMCVIVEMADFDMLYILARSVTRTPLLYFCTISFFFSIVIAFVTFFSSFFWGHFDSN